MEAKDMKRIAEKAKADGYNFTVKEIYKQVLRAAKVGEFEAEIAIIPWWDFKESDLDFFKNKKYQVELGEKSIYISWKAEF